jgi:hypothetical protein
MFAVVASSGSAYLLITLQYSGGRTTSLPCRKSRLVFHRHTWPTPASSPITSASSPSNQLCAVICSLIAYVVLAVVWLAIPDIRGGEEGSIEDEPRSCRLSARSLVTPHEVFMF